MTVSSRSDHRAARPRVRLFRIALQVVAVSIVLAGCSGTDEPGAFRTTSGAHAGASGAADSGGGSGGQSGSGGSRTGGSGGSAAGGSGGSPTGGTGGATGGAGGATGGAGGATGGTGGSTAGGAGAAGSSGAGGAAGTSDAGSRDASGTSDVNVDAGRMDGGDGRATDTTSADSRDGTMVADVSTDGAAGCGLANVVSKAYFDSIFPPANRHAVYTYEGFIAAAAAYPAFVNTGTVDACRREAAAFLANVKRETGSLKYAEQIAKESYCSSRTGCACDATTTDQTKWYYGRGALQLSWNYNYCSAGAALGIDLLAMPSQVATNPELAWKTALWFWMTSTGAGNATCHDTMATSGAFGETIRTINGGQECNMGGYGSVSGVTERVDAYIEFAKGLGIANPGQPTDLDC